jgi:hypothetical protein
MMKPAPLRGNFQLAYGTPFWTSKGAPMGSLVRRGFRGMGATDANGNTIVDLSYPVGTDPTSIDASGGGGINWGTVANVGSALTKDFASIYSTIQPVPAGCVKQTGPNGQSYIACGQPGASLGLPALTTGSNLTMLLLLGGGVLVVALLARRRG